MKRNVIESQSDEMSFKKNLGFGLDSNYISKREHSGVLPRLCFNMCENKRPVCFGMYDTNDVCEICKWRVECHAIAKKINSDITRKGTHIRIVSTYKEKKYKPKK
jgi:hypothetical protein